MKTSLQLVIIAVVLLAFPKFDFGQAPDLGTAANFVLFSTVGAVTNVGTTDPAKYLTHLTGNVGTNSGSSTGFGNVNGVMHDGDGASNACATDLLIAYNFLTAAIPDSSIMNPVFGNDSTLKAGTYLLPGATSLDLSLTLDAQGDPNAVFIFKMPASPPVYALSTSPNAKIILKNGAKASNVFWLVTGAVNVGTGTAMKGTIISGGAISLSANDTLEGRALTINGAIDIDNGNLGFLGYIPVTSLTGSKAPVFNESKTFTIFSSIGPVADDNFSHIVGDVGGNTAAPTNYNPLFVTGDIYGINGIKAVAAADLLKVYDTLNTARPEDIILLAPTLFGHNLVLTPHTYLMNAAVTFTDTLYLDALGNADAVFIIRTNGAFATTANSNVALINGTQAKNVYWLVNGAVSITANSIFNGTIVTAGGAIDILSGTTLNGRALATNGAVSTASINATVQSNNTISPKSQTVCTGDIALFSVSSSVTGLSYQWRKGNVDLVDGGNISGAKYDTLTIFPVTINDTSSYYYVVIKGASLPNDTSSKVSLSLNAIPTITSEPITKTICIGDSTSLTVSAKGTNLSYQWKRGTANVVNTANIYGATNDTLTFKTVSIADSASNYYVVVSGKCSPNDTSNAAALALHTAPIISSEPTDIKKCLGTSASFVVTATGAGLGYQWRKGLVNILGATTNTFTINPVKITDTASNYSVIVTGICSLTDTSRKVSLDRNLDPIIIVEPTNKVVCVGDTASFKVTATGTNLSYQWKKGTVDIVGATSNILTFNSAKTSDAALNYSVILSGTCTVNNSSTTVSLIVNAIPEASATTVSPVCLGHSITFTAKTVTDATYLWKNATAYSSTLQNPVIALATYADAGIYWLFVTANGCKSDSSTVTIAVSNCDTISLSKPEGFSPNGDGINDLFVIKGLENYPKNSIIVFNRWGTKVFDESPYLNNWDGKTTKGLRIGGDNLPIGTYFYILDLGDGSNVLKETLYLNR